MLIEAHPFPDAAHAALPPQTTFGAAAFPLPFPGTLEYNAPVRGPWNIVHTGMLLPQSHQIYVCADGCLRGVVLTAAEMKAMDRMSWVNVNETDMFNGHLEQDIIDGAGQILMRLPHLPQAVLLFISCIHQFAGCDMTRCISELSAQFPAVAFIDCYMTPTMRKSGLTPDQLIRRQLYRLLPDSPARPHTAAIVGNDRPTDSSSDLLRLLAAAGWLLRDLTHCRSYAEFTGTADSALLLTTLPAARPAAADLAIRTGRLHLHLPLAYGTAEIRRNLDMLASVLAVPSPDCTEAERAAERSLSQLRDIIGGSPVAIDYTATPRPAGLARLLLEHDIRVDRLYIDAFSPEEEEDFRFVAANFPAVKLFSTVHPAMLFAPPDTPQPEFLAIGQKAAWFCHTPHFVNMLAGGGHWGFDGICRLADEMIQARQVPKDTARLIQHKGLGCPSCIFD